MSATTKTKTPLDDARRRLTELNQEIQTTQTELTEARQGLISGSADADLVTQKEGRLSALQGTAKDLRARVEELTAAERQAREERELTERLRAYRQEGVALGEDIHAFARLAARVKALATKIQEGEQRHNLEATRLMNAGVRSPATPESNPEAVWREYTHADLRQFFVEVARANWLRALDVEDEDAASSKAPCGR